MATQTYYPEMQGNSEAPIQAEYVLGRYRVTAKKEITIKRGIEFNSIVALYGANNTPNKRAGWHKYYMTEKAFESFQKENEVVVNCLLD